MPAHSMHLYNCICPALGWQARTDMVHITLRTVSSWYTYCLYSDLSSGLTSRFLALSRRSVAADKMLRFLLFIVMLLHVTTANETSAYMMQTTAIYSDETCSGPSRNVLVVSNDDCAAQACSPQAFGNNTEYYQTVTCFSTDSFSYDPMEDLFLGKTFIEGQVYNNTNCSNDSYWFRLGLIVGGCEPFTTSYNNSVTATLSSDGSASMLLYNNTECIDPPMTTYALGNTTLAKHLCYEGISNTGLKQHIARYFIHQDYDTGSTGSDTKTTDSGSSSHTTVSIVSGIVAAFVVVLAIAAVIFSRRQKKRKHEQMDETLAVMETRFTTTEAMFFYRRGKADFAVSSQSTMPSDRSWDDDVIVAARIPRDKVILKTLISRGAFGEVYKGTYNGQVIAAKMLLVDTRRSIPHVNAFMAEVKMAAVMDHPHIAKFIGVAWDSLSGLCSVTEFMEGGDLKTLRTKYEEEGHSLGFDYIKVRIALHVAHALMYLHSLDPPVIHRDLKSRNILLSQDMEAKLTDFGISRERIDATMTAGVGTSLWMAPEIMMGNQYNEMADMFSFGVVLSELSTHAAPYSHIKLRSSSLQPMPRTVILQNVAAGKLSVDFSDEGPNSMVELGRACVAMDPRDRPTAAEALYRLHKVLTLEFQVE